MIEGGQRLMYFLHIRQMSVIVNFSVTLVLVFGTFTNKADPRSKFSIVTVYISASTHYTHY